MKHQYALGLLLAMSVVPALSTVRAAEPPNALISEIAWAGSEKSTADEWIEIRNTGTEALDISGWSLTGIGTSGSAITIPAAASISVGSTYLIANYSMTDPKTALVISPNLVTTAISIPNTSLNIALLDSTDTIIDSLTDPGTPNFGSSTIFSTMKRDLSSKTWFTEEASANVSHEIVTVAIETPTPSDPLTDPIAPIETIVDPVVAETIVADPVSTEPTIVEAPIEIPAIGIPVAITVAEAVETPVEPAVIETILVPEPVVAFPVVIEEPTVADPAPDLIEPIAIVESSIVNVPIVTPEIPTPTIDAPSAAPETIETILEPRVTPSSTAKIGDVILTEILSSPSTGNDEWVELRNMTGVPLVLDGLSLIDGSGKATDLSGTIDANGYTLIPNPSGKLNNDDDSVTLINGEVILDSVSYGDDTNAAPKKNAALALVDGIWIASTPTPASANSIVQSVTPATPEAPSTTVSTEAPIEIIIPTLSPTLYADTATLVAAESTAVTTNPHSTSSASRTPPPRANHVVTAVQSVATADPAPAPTSVKTASTAPRKSTTTKTTKPVTSTARKTSTSTKSAARSATINDIVLLTDGTKVKLEGIVVATAGTVGKRSFFLDGLEIYQSTGALADVKVGDRVSITGEVSVLSDHRRVNIQEGAASVIDRTNPIIHDYAPTLPYGSLVRITGTVSARDGNAVLLDTGSGMIKLVPGNGVAIAWTNLAGATITATGILKHGDQETLVLRSSEDIVKQQNDEAISAATTAGITRSQSSLLWLTGALLAASSAAFGTWVWYTRPKTRLSKLILHPTNV